MDKKKKNAKQPEAEDNSKLLKIETLDPKAAKPEDQRVATFFMKTVEKAEGMEQDGAQVYKGTASSNVVDRDEEVMLPMGMHAENYQNNPVLLFAHDYRGMAVGKTTGLAVNEENVDFEFLFAKTEEAQKLEHLYSEGFMRGFSVTFNPLKRLYINDETPEKFTVEVNGKNLDIDLKKYDRRPRLMTLEWELLEISCVSVPANQNALLHSAKVLGLKTLEGIDNPVQKGLAEEQIDFYMKQLADIFDGITTAPIECKTVVPQHSTPIDMELAWSGSDARTKAALFASSDGSGDKDKMDWAKYSKFFTRYDDSKADQFTAYALPHHTVVDGKMVGVWKGIVAAMAALFGSRGAKPYTSEDEKKKMYNHLAKHYKDADKEPPEYKAYTEEELCKIFPEIYTDAKDTQPAGDGQEGDPPANGEQPTGEQQPDAMKSIQEQLTAIEAKLATMSEAISTQNVHLCFIKEYLGGQQKGESPNDETGDETPELDDDTRKALKEFLDEWKEQAENKAEGKE